MPVPRSRPRGAEEGGASRPGGQRVAGNPPQRPASWTPSWRRGPGSGLRAEAGAGRPPPRSTFPVSEARPARRGAAGGVPAPLRRHHMVLGAGGGSRPPALAPRTVSPSLSAQLRRGWSAARGWAGREPGGLRRLLPGRLWAAEAAGKRHKCAAPPLPPSF